MFSLPLAVLVILFKEVSIYYIPALSLVVLWRLRQRWSLKASLCWSAFYGSGSALLGYGFLKMMQWVLPGLAESQQQWLHTHFSQEASDSGISIKFSRNMGNLRSLLCPAVPLLDGVRQASFRTFLKRSRGSPFQSVLPYRLHIDCRAWGDHSSYRQYKRPWQIFHLPCPRIRPVGSLFVYRFSNAGFPAKAHSVAFS